MVVYWQKSEYPNWTYLGPNVEGYPLVFWNFVSRELLYLFDCITSLVSCWMDTF